MPYRITVPEPPAEATPWLQRLVRELQILAGSQGSVSGGPLPEQILARLIPDQRSAREECVARTLLIESALRHQLRGASGATLAALSALNALRPGSDGPANQGREERKPLPRDEAACTTPAIRKAIDIIRREYANPSLGLGSVAPRVGLSPSGLCRRFHRETGVEFMKFLLRVRMNSADALLRDSCLSIKEISTRAGYEYPANFTRAFRAAFGVCPRDVRSTGTPERALPQETDSRHSRISMSNLG